MLGVDAPGGFDKVWDGHLRLALGGHRITSLAGNFVVVASLFAHMGERDQTLASEPEGTSPSMNHRAEQ